MLPFNLLGNVISFTWADASGWLKVHQYAEVPEQDGHLPLLSIYGYCLVIG